MFVCSETQPGRFHPPVHPRHQAAHLQGPELAVGGPQPRNNPHLLPAQTRVSEATQGRQSWHCTEDAQDAGVCSFSFNDKINFSYRFHVIT